MAKANLKAKLVDKGEKYLLMGAGGLMLLFGLLGVMELSSAPDPNAFEKEVEGNAAKVKGVVNGNPDPKFITALDPDFGRPYVIAPIKSNWANHLFFDPIAPPDKRRINPTLLPITELQADYVPAKILSYDIQEAADGGLRIGIAVGASKKDDKLDADKSGQAIKDLTPRFNGMRFPANRGGENRGENRPKGEGQPKKDRKLPEGAPIEGGERQNVEYVALDPEKLLGKRFAWTLYPQRMVIVQASFPYKAEIEEIQKALRLESPLDVFDVYKPEEVPLFRGVLVQRQILYPDGKVETPWSDLDVSANYDPIQRRKYGDKADDANTNFVLLHKGHRLTMPLPILISGKYPDIRMQSIKDAINKQLAIRKPPPVPKAPSQFTGGGDIFDPIAPSSSGAVGQPKLEGEGINFPKLVKEGDKDLDVPSTEAKFAEVPDHILIRLIDNDIQPGRLYQYRMKMLMQNPNWVGAKDKRGNVPYKDKLEKVSRPSDAEIMLIGADEKDKDVIKQRIPNIDADDLRRSLVAATPWTELQGTVTVPREEFLFATDPASLNAKGNWSPNLKVGQGVLQIQRWLPVASIDKWKEPVADWVVADIVATRSSYLGGKQVVNLPKWSSQFNRYILSDAPPDKGKSRRGVLMDPTKPGPQYVVADVEGGLRENRPLTRTSLISEETAAEILLLDENGNLQVRSSYADRTDPGRAEREAAWKTWIEKTEKDTASLLPDSGAKKKEGFD